LTARDTVTSILTAISGQFGKSIVLGTLLPVAFFLGVNTIITLPLIPPGAPLADALEAMDGNRQILVVTFIACVATGLLYTLNVPLMRLFEGYPWKDSWLGRWRRSKYVGEMADADARWRGMRSMMYAWPDADMDADRRARCTTEWIRQGQIVNRVFPSRPSSVLPTRLGNVVRSFEHYPDRQYQIAAVTIWPRLVAKIDKDYASSLDDAKTSVDFTINCSFLSVLTAGLLVLLGLAYPLVISDGWALALWLVEIGTVLVIAHAFYRMAIGRAAAWGDLIKGAFDLYRRPLLESLGYRRKPSTLKAEREIWNDISNQIVYGDSPRVRPLDFVGSPTFARGEPATIALDTTRGVRLHALTGKRTIVICVHNGDPDGRNASNVEIIEVLDGWEYVWDSVHSADGAIAVTGTNPYRFRIGTIPTHSKFTFSFEVVPAQKAEAK
jgi:hypothetical protein